MTITSILAIGILLAVLAQACLILVGSWMRWRTEMVNRHLLEEKLHAELQQVRSSREASSVHTTQAWKGWRNFVVTRKLMENHNTCSLQLEPEDGKPLGHFSPGQFVALELAVSGEKQPTIRCYSLSAAPLSRAYWITVRRQLAPDRSKEIPDGVASSYIHDGVAQGSVLRLRAPAGTFTIDHDSSVPLVLIAGGVGITPFLGLIEMLACRRSDRDVHLYYSVRTPDDLIKLSLFRAALDEMKNFRLDIILTGSGGASRMLDHLEYHDRVWIRRGRRLAVDMVLQGKRTTGGNYYVCGSAAMMKSILDGLSEAGVPKERLHSEDFGVGGALKQEMDARRSLHTETHDVTFSKSGRKVTWSADKGTILDLAEEAGIDVSCSCRSGNCGACALAVEGAFSYNVEPGVDPGPGRFLPCVAIPTSDLVLEA